jgi:NifU-like protein involved in Fe-S cluster formation
MSEHFSSPRHVGRVEQPSGVGRASNPACGDELELSLRSEAGRVAEARFLAKGCSALIATASLVTDALVGTTLAAARALDPAQLVLDAGGLPERGRHAIPVVGRALAQALRAVRADGDAPRT